MWFQIFVFFILCNILFASPPGSRESASDKSNQINRGSRDDKKIQQPTSSSYSSNFYFGSEPQRTPLDLSIKNRQIIQYAPPSTSGAKKATFDCSRCGKSYTTAANLRIHVDEKHEGKKAMCSECGRSFDSVNTRNYHKRTYHQGQTFDCTRCGRKFNTKQNLKYHERAKH